MFKLPPKNKKYYAKTSGYSSNNDILDYLYANGCIMGNKDHFLHAKYIFISHYGTLTNSNELPYNEDESYYTEIILDLHGKSKAHKILKAISNEYTTSKA